MTDEVHRLLKTIPARGDPDHADLNEEIAGAADLATRKRAEAKRDAISVVALAIVRRGSHPVTDWSTKDVQTAEAIADMLFELETP